MFGIHKAALVVLVAGGLTAPAVAQEEDLTARGRRLYEIYCRSCHGETGIGDGPTADLLRVPPADLTRLRRSSDAEFPFARTYRVIDGRESVKAHGPTGMPIWGLAFQDMSSDTNQEDEVRGRILQLIHYLQTIQRVNSPRRTGLSAEAGTIREAD